MMQRLRSKPLRWLATAGLFALFTPASVVRAQEPGTAEFGFEQRVRNENWNNVFDLSGATNDERNQIRFRSRVWGRLPLTQHIDLNFGLNSENVEKVGQPDCWDEVMFETANLHIRDLFVKGLSLKIGRQDLMRGEGLILMEGTSGDGSRTLYFNAAVLGYTFRKSNLEAIAILNPRRDHFLPRINDQYKNLQEWDEQAVGLYYTDKNLARTTVEAYFFHKTERNDFRAPTHAQYQPDRRIETLGTRVTRSLSKSWSATGEFAGQWGEQHPNTPIRAWAGYGYVRKNLDAAWKPYILGGFGALSGDDPTHPERINGWDPLFARWPKWGDMELYTQFPEKGPGYATNQTRWQLESGISPARRVAWRFTYYHVGAFHPFAGKRSVFGSGLTRGDNFQSRLDFSLNPMVRGHIVYETLVPGSFYSQKGRPYFLRFEMTAQAKGAIHNFQQRLHHH